MSFKHVYPNITQVIGYLRDAKKIGEAKGGGPKVRAILYNPSVKHETFDLLVPIIAFGRCGESVLECHEAECLTSVIGRICMAKNPRGSRVEILCDHVANLDEEIDEGYKENENATYETRY
jgi:hypothetical protein|tara:strand:- start:11279 stop:11641 length:363 start_codon:yes stop_codon:yes gene_type:complete